MEGFEGFEGIDSSVLVFIVNQWAWCDIRTSINSSSSSSSSIIHYLRPARYRCMGASRKQGYTDKN